MERNPVTKRSCCERLMRETQSLGRLACALAITALASAVSAAYAQQLACPGKAIRILASPPPGGGIDAVARVVSTRLAEAMGQAVIVDNRLGANGSLATELTAKSSPDGYTLMVGAIGNLAINAFSTPS